MEVREEGSYAGSSVSAALLPDPETPSAAPWPWLDTMAETSVSLLSVDGKVKTKALEQVWPGNMGRV